MIAGTEAIRPRSGAAWAGVAMGIAAFAYLAWDSALWDARLQLLLHLGAIAVVLLLAARALRGDPLPRTSLDAPILALLAAFALATMLAINVGMSLRATASIVAFTAMLPAALLVLRRHAAIAALVVALPIIALAAGALGALLARRVAWVLAGLPGVPPLRVLGEGTPFGSVAVPPFVLLATWAVAGHLPPAWRRPVRRTIVALAVPLTVLSGSRSAWLAVAVTAAILVGPAVWGGRLRFSPRRVGRTALAAVAGAAVLGAIALLVLPRLTAVTSLLYRGDLWTDTLRAWATDPWTGIGPGFMPYARHAAAPPNSFPVDQPHSHNLAIGVLGDAGVIGLAAAILVVVAFARVGGPWRARTARGREASAVLLGFLVAGLFEDLTFLPGFVLLVVLLVATALLDAGGVSWVPIRRPRLALAGAIPIAASLLLAQVVADAGAIAYRGGTDALVDGDRPAAVAAFDRAITLDPWHPMAPDALGIARADAGDLVGARAAFHAAVGLDPGNGRAWANLAVVCWRLDDTACASDAATEAVAYGSHEDVAILNAAAVLADLGREDDAAEAYRRAALIDPTAAFVVPPRHLVGLDSEEAFVLDGQEAPELLRLIVAARSGQPVDPDEFRAASTRWLAAAIAGDADREREERDRAMVEERASLQTWSIALALGRQDAGDTSAAERAYAAIAGRPPPDATGAEAPPPFTLDIGSFRAVPADGFPAIAADLRTDPPYPWVLAELVAGR